MNLGENTSIQSITSNLTHLLKPYFKKNKGTQCVPLRQVVLRLSPRVGIHRFTVSVFDASDRERWDYAYPEDEGGTAWLSWALYTAKEDHPFWDDDLHHHCLFIVTHYERVFSGVPLSKDLQFCGSQAHREIWSPWYPMFQKAHSTGEDSYHAFLNMGLP